MEETMELLTAGDIAKSCSSEIVSGRADTAVLDICIDSRKATEGCLFVAIKGNRVEGHDYIQMAFEK